MKNSNEKKMADSRSLGSKQAAKAELEAKLQRSQSLQGFTLLAALRSRRVEIFEPGKGFEGWLVRPRW